MKYIKTKDGIYKSKRKVIEKDCLVIGEKENGEIGFVRKDIIKQADTIEELCDLYVLVDKTTFEEPMYYVIETFEELYLVAKEPSDMIYGGIWTDKGLTYVAKLNDKGKLELI